MATTSAERLAEWICAIDGSELPGEVASKARQIAQHSWGVQLGTSRLPWCRAVEATMAREGGARESVVAGRVTRLPSPAAAFVNGTFAHAFEFDDNHAASGVKVGCVAVPTGLAVGETVRASGPELSAAIALGAEVMIRVGLAIRAGRFARGGHATGTAGAIGAAVVTSRLLGLDRRTTAQAIAGAAATILGTTEAPAEGRGHLKRTFGGAAASAGIRAARLAEAGITAPLTMLEPGAGLFRAFDVQPPAASELLAGLGETWHVSEVHYKIYAQDGYIQPMSQALEQLRSEHSFAVEDVATVRVGTNSHALHDIVGKLRNPRDLTDAQFSGNFSVALMLCTGDAGFDAYTETNLADPRIRELSERVVLELDDEVEREFQRTRPRGARVTIALRSGREFSSYVPNLRRLSDDELQRKFLGLAARELGETAAHDLAGLLTDWDEIDDVARIADALVARSPCGGESAVDD